MIIRSSRVFVWAIVLCVSATLSGCGGDEKSGDTGLEKTNIKIGTVPVTGSAPLYLGIKEKIFEKEGITVQPQLLQGSDKGIPLLSRGDLDVLFGNYVTFFQAHQKGVLKIKVLSEANQTATGNVSVLVKDDSPIRTGKDLEGKKVAILIPKGWQELTLNAGVRTDGGDPSKIKYVSLPLPNMGPALERGDIDAAYQGEPFLSRDHAKYGFRKAIDPVADSVADWPLSGYFATEDFVRKYPKTAAAFQRGMLKAQAMAADRRKIVGILPDFVKIDRSLAAVITLDAYPSSISPIRLQRVADRMKLERVLQQPIDVRHLIFTAPA